MVWKSIKRDRYLLMLLVPVVIYFFIFHYIPMYGVLIAFKNFTSAANGMLSGPWVGFKWFAKFFDGIYFYRLVKNTLLLNIYGIIWGFPVPIIFALMLNELRGTFYKRLVQTVSYLPHFISVVVVSGMIVNFLSVSGGIVNILLGRLGIEPIKFLLEPHWFRTVFIGSDIWQSFGWNSIIYLAAISGIDPQLYEAAEIDGANRLRKMIHITLMGILPTIVILLILRMGSLMSIGFEKILLLYNPSTYEVSDVISTYVYRIGLLGAQFSFGAAVGLFNSVINLVLLLFVNTFSKKVSGTALW